MPSNSLRLVTYVAWLGRLQTGLIWLAVTTYGGLIPFYFDCGFLTYDVFYVITDVSDKLNI